MIMKKGKKNQQRKFKKSDSIVLGKQEERKKEGNYTKEFKRKKEKTINLRNEGRASWGCENLGPAKSVWPGCRRVVALAV